MEDPQKPDIDGKSRRKKMDVLFKGCKTRHTPQRGPAFNRGRPLRRARPKKPQCVVYLYEMSSTWKSSVTVSEFVEKGLGVTAKRDRASFWSGGMFWN